MFCYCWVFAVFVGKRSFFCGAISICDDVNHFRPSNLLAEKEREATYTQITRFDIHSIYHHFSLSRISVSWLHIGPFSRHRTTAQQRFLGVCVCASFLRLHASREKWYGEMVMKDAEIVEILSRNSGRQWRWCRRKAHVIYTWIGWIEKKKTAAVWTRKICMHGSTITKRCFDNRFAHKMRVNMMCFKTVSSQQQL